MKKNNNHKRGFKIIMTLVCTLLMVISSFITPIRVFADEEATEKENAVVETVAQAVEEAPVNDTKVVVEKKEEKKEEIKEEIKEEKKEEQVKETAEKAEEAEETVKAPEKAEEIPAAEERIENVEADVLPNSEAAEEIKEAPAAVTEEIKTKAPIEKNAQAQAADKIKITLHLTGIKNTNGSEKTATVSNTLSMGSGWNVLLKKFENNLPAKEIRAGGAVYKYTGNWVDGDGNIVTFPLKFQAKDYEADVDFYYSPVYDVTLPAKLEFNNIDNISTASHQWTNIDGFTGYTHTFKQPESQPHYQFVYWQDGDTNETYVAGDKRSIASSEIKAGEVMTVKVYTVWQPSITVNYYDDNGKLLNSIETFENHDLYAYSAADRGSEEFIGWSYSQNGQILADQTYEKPALTRNRVEQTVYNVYGVWQTNVVVEHYQEELDGSFSLKDSEMINNVIVNTTVKADSREYTGFTFDGSVEGTMTKAVAKGGLVLKLYYTRNSYQVTYEFENAPEGAVLPEAETYKYGADVRVADVEAVEGYTFSGWDREDFVMGAGDVNVKGSWQINHYTVTWIDANGKVLETDEEVEYGSMPSYDGKTPSKKTDSKYSYKFKGWSPEITEVREDVVYQATYSKKAVSAPQTPDVPSKKDPVKEEPAIEETVEPVVEIEEPVVDIEDITVPAADIEIEDVEVPMAESGAWALANLMASVLSVATALWMIISFTRKEENSEEEKEEKEESGNRRISKTFGIIPAVVSVIIFILTEDMTQPMILTDRYTLVMMLILLSNLMLALVTRNRDDKEQKQKEEYAEQLAMD